jgi:hypothetical protein
MVNQVYHHSVRFDATAAAPAAVERVFKAVCDHYIFQLERGEKTGREHYQCYLHTKTKCRSQTELSATLRGLLEYEGTLNCSPASNNGKQQLKHYCMKEDTKVDGPWMDRPAPPAEYDGQDVQCIESSPFPWQKFIIDEIKKKPKARTINCVVDPAGCMGKSTLQKYLLWKKRVIQVPIGTAAQLKTYIGNVIKAGVPTNCFMINFNRCMGKENTYRDVLTVVESLKVGVIIPTMYGGTSPILFNIPHVWIFCNEAPPRKCLSPDMWKFWQYSPTTKSIVPFEPKEPEKVSRVRHYQHTSSAAPGNDPTPWDRSVRRRTNPRPKDPLPKNFVDEYITVPESEFDDSAYEYDSNYE